MKNSISLEKKEIIDMNDIDMREAYDEYQVRPTDQDREDMADWELKQDAKPFINDFHILRPNRYENILEDMFERHTLTDRWGLKSDDEYDKEILDDMLDATPDWTPQDFDQQRAIDYRVQTNFDKIIFRECMLAYGEIKHIEPTSAGDCKIPSHLRPENIAKFTRISNKRCEGVYDNKSEAEIVAKMYRIIEADFATVLQLNKAIRERDCHAPWDCKINAEGLTLKELAENMKEMALGVEPAETVEGKAMVVKTFEDLNQIFPVQIDKIDHNINEDIARFIPADWEQPEQEFEQVNNIGEYTYHSLHKIPQSKHLNGDADNVRPLIKALAFIEQNTFKPETLAKLNNWADDNLDWDQQAVYDKTVQTSMQERARRSA